MTTRETFFLLTFLFFGLGSDKKKERGRKGGGKMFSHHFFSATDVETGSSVKGGRKEGKGKTGQETFFHLF